MKKVIYLLVLCMVLGMAGCGTNQENKEPVSGNVSVEIENKENDDVVQNEQTADTGSYPPCVMVDGVIYKDTGYVASMPGCGTMDGEIVSTVAGTELPSENNQSNFGSGYHYQRSSEGQLIVVIDDERIIFRDIEKVHIERFISQPDMNYIVTCIIVLGGVICFAHIMKYYVLQRVVNWIEK